MGEAFITRRGGNPPVPGIFGDGKDGDLYVAAGQTVVLPVGVPHQSIVEKQYKSINIAAGGVLKCSNPNAGLVLRCKGDCTINGTIDQSMMAPFTNPNNTYSYPPELVCGDGGRGGNGAIASGGSGMVKRIYGGGYGGGGGGARGNANPGGGGGNASNSTVSVGAHTGRGGDGGYAGGGYAGGAGGAGGGGNGSEGSGSGGARFSGGGGGGGGWAGGIIMLYVGQHLNIAGRIIANGQNGGNGASGSSDYPLQAGGGGGGGGGAIYLMYQNSYVNTGSIEVNGGLVGSATSQAVAGTIGTVTIKKYTKGMTV